MLDVLRQKCEFKGIAVPGDIAALEPHRADLEGAWGHMLGHQLPALPPVENFWNALPEFFAWLQTGVAPDIPAAYEVTAGETVLRERTLRLPVSGAAQSYLEVIRFAAVNRLCVDLLYKNETRRIEPYSLRRTKDGNIILHAYDIRKQGLVEKKLHNEGRHTFLLDGDNVRHGLNKDLSFIPSSIDQNPCAHFRVPMDMIFHG